jgi:hypothetical protein
MFYQQRKMLLNDNEPVFIFDSKLHYVHFSIEFADMLSKVLVIIK